MEGLECHSVQKFAFNDDIAQLVPEKPDAYELGYKGEVVYIGSTKRSIRERLYAHRKSKKFISVTHVRFKSTSSEEARPLAVKLCKEFVKENGRLPRLHRVAPRGGKAFIDKLLYG